MFATDTFHRLSVTSPKNPQAKPVYRRFFLREKINAALVGCRNHNFSWPSSCLKRVPGFVYPKGFDSHQTCTKCGTERFYNSETLTPGPRFVRISGHRHLAA